MAGTHQEWIGDDQRFGQAEPLQYARKLGQRAAADCPQPGLRTRKRKTPPGCSLASSSSQPVVAQKCSKSLVAPGSVAITSSTAPGASGFNARRAFSTGS